MIKTKNIKFSYNKSLVLKDLSLELKPKAFTTIIGPNGSGKTTLMNLLTKNHHCVDGEILIEGKNIKHYTIESIAKTIAVIAQNEQIKFPFSCLEIVMLGRKPHLGRFGKYEDKDFQLVHKMMELTDTLKFVDTPITQISGGEFQRVMLARALAQEPKILFLDEAFSAMDLSYKMNFLKIIKELVVSSNLSVVAVMHDINLAYKFSDDLCILQDGELKIQGNPKDVLTKEVIKDVFNVESEYVPDKGFLFT